MDTTTVAGHTRLFPNRLDADSLGRILLGAESAGGLGYDTNVLRWNDTSWVSVANLGYGTAYLHPIVSTGPGVPLVWQTIDDIERPGLPYVGTYLVTGNFDGERIADLDTLAVVWNGSFNYTAAASPRRRWVAKQDYTNGLKVWYADTLHMWRAVPIPEVGNEGFALAPLNDTTALMTVQSFAGGLTPAKWGLIRGSGWVAMGTLPRIDPGLEAAGPRLRRSPSGAYWDGWATGEGFVELTTYTAGTWTTARRLTCRQRFAGQMIDQFFAISRDPWHERPAVAWLEYNADRGFSGEICVCAPNDSGYPEGESLVIDADPTWMDVFQDRNDDVWVVWREQFWGMYWTHSYVTALASKPRPVGDTRPTVNWSLSTPAPGSYWAVLRARRGGPYEQVARVRAGPGTEMSWLDADAPFPEMLHYRIRRESVDRRYEQTSSDAVWLPRKARLWVEAPIEQSGSGLVRLQVYGAPPGALDSRAFDLQGREVARLHAYASGTGEDQLEFVLSGPSGLLPSGIYFVRVADATGRTSDAIKAVVVR